METIKVDLDCSDTLCQDCQFCEVIANIVLETRPGSRAKSQRVNIASCLVDEQALKWVPSKGLTSDRSLFGWARTPECLSGHIKTASSR